MLGVWVGVECLRSLCKALDLTPSTAKKSYPIITILTIAQVLLL
jgi:hypothetical protein